MAAYSVFTRIVGEDGLSEVFRKVGAAATTAFKPVKAFNQAVGEPKASALGRVGAKVDEVSGKFRSGLKSITSWLPALGAIGTTASLAGLWELTRKTAEGFEGVQLATQKLGVAGKDLAVWRYGAKQTQVDTDALVKSLVRLKKNMYDAATGKNKDVAALFAAMKIPLRDAAGHIKNVDQVMDDLAESFKNTTDEETKNRAALALFGKQGADLLPFLNRGREGLAEWRREQQKYYKLNDEQRANLGELAESYKKLDRAGEGLSQRLGASFAPVMSHIIGGTAEWIARNRELIGLSVDRKVEKIGQAFEFVAGASEKAASKLGIDEYFRGMNAATAFDFALAALGITMAGPLLAGIQFVTVAWARMTATMLANPLGAALALAALEVYALRNHWEEDWKAIADSWSSNRIESIFQTIVRFNGFRLMAQGAIDMVKELTGIDLSKIFTFWLQAIENIGPQFQAAWAKLAPSWLKDFTSVTGRWMGANTVPSPATAVPSGFGGVAADYAASYANRVPTVDPLAAAVNAAAPPQRLEIVLSGEVKTPPGSTITATTRGVGPSQSADVGRSMWDGGDH